MKILVLNGPNLNLLGDREVDIYGNMTLAEIKGFTENALQSYAVDMEWKQSNHEGEMIEIIHSIRKSDHDALIINPGAFSHTSLALMDALRSVAKPIVEVHLSNTAAREEYRRTKLTAQAVESIIEGLGKDVYLVAVLALLIKKGLWHG
ncbi:MAG: 3-dehydroquinate dehydratase [Halobacteriovorax sp.]|nr:3-dehydroquinate dehydratase [Halobacteriovorax sp.]|tara:strand:- start:594 stop:1040 length:447 start_codon:yes stop_codon:yes gene_type:complete